MQSGATLRGEINIKAVTFRFYADIKDAKQENISEHLQMFYLNFTLINGGEIGQCSQQRD